MADYDYEEGGFMALYFVLTFLTIILIPLTSSYLVPAFRKESSIRCQCSRCITRRGSLRLQSSPYRLIGPMTIILCLWAVFLVIAYKLATTRMESKIYDPFEILGLTPTSDEKFIKRHYKKLSVKFHPDKVRLAVNQTMEDVSNYFVDLTKAYKALTDETVRENLRLYGNPDGKQDFKVGIALPPWVIESSNNGWVLGSYALLFGGALPYLVGRWWFGSRRYTKDGVKARTAEMFFKSLSEDDLITDVMRILAQGWCCEVSSSGLTTLTESSLFESIERAVGRDQWCRIFGGLDESARVVLSLLYAHLLQLPIEGLWFQREKDLFLSRTPQLLSSLLAITISHNWLKPTLHVMHLHSCVVQGLLPESDELLQLPSVSTDAILKLAGASRGAQLLDLLAQRGPPLVNDIQNAAQHTWRLEVLDLYLKVLGERIVTPGAIVQLVFLARLIPMTQETTEAGHNLDSKPKDERHQAFWSMKNDAEEIAYPATLFAHAPQWRADRKPHWWVLIGDLKQNRIFVPPTKISDVPLYLPTSPALGPKDRLYKLTFQAPPNVGSLSLQVHFVSDTFVGDDIHRTITLKIEDNSISDERISNDYISDPEEDSLAGQLAALRGGTVKRPMSDSEVEDESTTDGELADSTDTDSD